MTETTTSVVGQIIKTSTSSFPFSDRTLGIAILVFAILFAIYLFAHTILWVITLIDIAKIEKLKNHKVMWVLLVIFFGILGGTIYGFAEDRKKIAWWNLSLIIFSLAVPLLILGILGVAMLTK